MNEDVFELIASLTGASKQKKTYQATKLVLVDGLSQVEARKALGITSRSPLSESIKKYLEVDLKIRKTYRIEHSDQQGEAKS